MGRSAVAVSGQHAIWLCRMGLAAGASLNRHGCTDGATGAGIWHGRIGSMARRATIPLEAYGCGPGYRRTGDQSILAPIASDIYRQNHFLRTSSGYRCHALIRSAGYVLY